ncbi:MAG TPA: phenylalanine--tRNA ligase subunit beta [Acidilobales archaeon]|nr:MAG: phenylalanine--tRNA ligase subunit beta [Desulfurococcales archaeon ex4484_42]HDD26557.1 phenylalanine--tRNA ligase subunit beta [Acidilobales archaeon]
MPTFKVRVSRLMRLIGVRLSLDELIDVLFKLKAEAEIENDYLVVEVGPDRLDMMSSIKLAKAIRWFLGIEKPSPNYVTESSDVVVEVKEVPSRPYIVAAVVEGVVIDEDLLEELIQLQEKLHITYGRGRRKVAIGLHDLSKLPCRKIRYEEVNLSTKMIPLFVGKEMTVKEVLEVTEQGQKYGKISLRGNKHPAVIACNDIIALPPVINSEITRLEVGSKGLFIDVTGTDWKAINDVLNILTTTLADEGGKVRAVRLTGVINAKVPNLKCQEISLSPNYVNEVLGTSLTINDVAKALMRLGHGVEIGSTDLIVKIPPYRLDILHPIDLVEDVAVGIGYDELGIEELSIGKPTELSRRGKLIKNLRELLVGHGFIEVHTFTLTDEEVLKLLGYERDSYVKLKNPVSMELNALKNTHLATLLLVLRKSQHAALPVKIFEIGNVVVKKEGPTGWGNELRLGMALMDSEVSFEELQAPLFSVMRLLGFEIKTKPSKHPALIDGRCAKVIINGKNAGYIGEVKPEVLTKLGIEYPVVVSEVSIDKLLI